jgi:hypothetical protein
MVNETICDVLSGQYGTLFAYTKAYGFVVKGCFDLVFFGKAIATCIRGASLGMGNIGRHANTRI